MFIPCQMCEDFIADNFDGTGEPCEATTWIADDDGESMPVCDQCLELAEESRFDLYDMEV